MKAILAAILALLGPAGLATANLGNGSVPKSTAPTKVAWYDATRPSAITPAAPMPGVSKSDLLVEGLTINTALLPISLPIPTIREVTAYTALQFQIPDGATPGGLTLHLSGFTTAAIDSKLPSGVTPIACPATSSFKSGPQQPTSAAPKYDCSKRSTVGQIGDDGKTVTFPGISRLLTRGHTLSIVILPGSLGLERLVFSAPGKDALSLLDFTLPTTSVPPVTPVPTPTISTSTAAQPPVTAPIFPPPPGVVVTPSAPAPVIASSSPAMVIDASSGPDDGRERTRAIGLLITLVVATAWFAFTDRRSGSTEMGVGRFRSARTGPPPTI
ncbi:MAG TPA: hypothetical protein VHW74_01775 [Mycobacteriales bacterium]|nr:hypothetical protein [Mycobacteriales bacterium]